MLPWSATLEPPGHIYASALVCAAGYVQRATYPGAARPGPGHEIVDAEVALPASPRKWRRGLFRFNFFSIFFFISSRLPGLSTIHNAYPRANNAENAYPRATLERNIHIFNVRHLPWSYPRPKRPRIRRAPALGLPWSYPGARLLHNHVERLPWTYPRPTLERDSYVAGPGAYPAPTLERLPGRLPLRTWPFSPSSSSFPAVLPPPPPARPKAPRSPKTPPPPAYPGALPGPWPGPSRGLRPGGRPGRPALGSRSNSHFPQKEFVWESGQIDSRPDEQRTTYPGATLEPAGEDEDERPDAQGQGRRGERDALPWSRGPAYPTPPRGGKVEKHTTNQKPNATKINPYAPPRRRMYWGNRGEVRLTLSRS